MQIPILPSNPVQLDAIFQRNVHQSLDLPVRVGTQKIQLKVLPIEPVQYARNMVVAGQLKSPDGECRRAEIQGVELGQRVYRPRSMQLNPDTRVAQVQHRPNFSRDMRAQLCHPLRRSMRADQHEFQRTAAHQQPRLARGGVAGMRRGRAAQRAVHGLGQPLDAAGLGTQQRDALQALRSHVDLHQALVGRVHGVAGAGGGGVRHGSALLAGR